MYKFLLYFISFFIPNKNTKFEFFFSILKNSIKMKKKFSVDLDKVLTFYF